MEHLIYAVPIGAGATAVVDLWSVVRKRVLGVPAPDYGLVGRWIGWMGRGRFRHDRIGATPAVRAERTIGWASHYLIGIAFAGMLLGFGGAEWLQAPTPGLALAFGIATVAAPFVLMQPGMGAGIAGSRTPRPNAARVQSLATHAIFGLGLYAAGVVTRFLIPGA